MTEHGKWHFEVSPADATAYLDWLPASVPLDASIKAVVRLECAGRGPAIYEARWDNRRESVRSPEGELLWYRDSEVLAFASGGVLQVQRNDEHVLLPMGPLANEALCTRSVRDLADWAHLERVESVRGNCLRMAGEDGVTAEIVRSPQYGLVTGSGLDPLPWRLEVDSTSVSLGSEPWLDLSETSWLRQRIRALR